METTKYGIIWSQNVHFVTTVSLTRTGVLYPRVRDFLNIYRYFYFIFILQLHYNMWQKRKEEGSYITKNATEEKLKFTCHKIRPNQISVSEYYVVKRTYYNL